MVHHHALVVDDDTELRETVSSVLEDSGFKVTAAENGLAALDRLSHMEPPSVIVLDLMMPRMNGWELLERVRSIPQLLSVPVVAMSASVLSPEEKNRFDAFLTKPFSIDAIERTLSVAMALRRVGSPSAA